MLAILWIMGMMKRNIKEDLFRCKIVQMPRKKLFFQDD